MTKRKSSQALYDDNLIMDQKKQNLQTDVMHPEGQHFMVTACESLHLVLQCPLERETALDLGTAFQKPDRVTKK